MCLELLDLEFDLHNVDGKGESEIPNIYGYIRVPSRKQDADPQAIVSGEVGMSGKIIYTNKQEFLRLQPGQALPER